MVYTLVVHLYAKDDPECIKKLMAKLQEASQVYSNDKETLSCQQYHLNNPYWKTFDPYVLPLLEKPMDLRRLNELDTSKEVRVTEDKELWKSVEQHQHRT
ncbi:hypothetical protein LTR28_005241 [Elasticomyces elasticus]|nr:hypothetical protein LTR28_005241 [Elasticomyces elasticus]